MEDVINIVNISGIRVVPIDENMYDTFKFAI